MNIKWLNLRKMSDRFRAEGPVAKGDVLLPDLFLVGLSNGHYIYSAPLLSRLYTIPREMITTPKPLEFKPEYRDAFKQAYLLHSPSRIRALLPAPFAAEKQHYLRILMTSACNLQCSYCYSFSETHPEVCTIDPNAIFPYIERLATKVLIEFHGNGEPTLAFKEIKALYELIKQQRPEASFTLQTNGLYSAEVRSWLHEHHIHITFSIDGPRDIQQVQRPDKTGSTQYWDTLMDNISEAQRHNTGKSAIVTVTRYSLPHLDKIYDFLTTKGFQHLKINPLVKLGRAATGEETFRQAPDPKAFAEALASLSVRAYANRILISSDFLPSFHLRQPAYERCGAVCRQWMISMDGQLFACSDGLCSSSEDNPFIVGTVTPDQVNVDAEREHRISRHSLRNLPQCQRCMLKWQCAGGCMVENISHQGQISTPDSRQCRARLWYATLYLMNLARLILLKPQTPSVD